MSKQQSHFNQVFDEIATRFFYNLPQSELENFERIFIHLQQAHWYYLDNYCDITDMQSQNLEILDLKVFCLEFFNKIDYFKKFKSQFDECFADFQSYLYSIPVCGGILLNPSMSKCVLVRGKKSNSWSFPRGKVNQNEQRIDCAIREVEEEIGFTMHCNPDEFISKQLDNKMCTLFIDSNVLESTAFETRTNNEIFEIAWFSIDKLPSHKSSGNDKKNFYNICPFMESLRKWINSKRRSASNPKSNRSVSPLTYNDRDFSSPSKNYEKSPAKGFDLRNFDTFGSTPTWTPEQMFAANSRLDIKVAPEDIRPCRYMKIVDVKDPLTSFTPSKSAPVSPRSRSANSVDKRQLSSAHIKNNEDILKKLFQKASTPISQPNISPRSKSVTDTPKREQNILSSNDNLIKKLFDQGNSLLTPTPVSNLTLSANNSASKPLFQFRMNEILK